MNAEIHYDLDNVVAFRDLHESREPSLGGLGLLAEWSGIAGLSLSGREDWLEVVLPTL